MTAGIAPRWGLLIAYSTSKSIYLNNSQHIFTISITIRGYINLGVPPPTPRP